ncbi:MAG: SDR family oxidoreductase [bacterium]
MSEEQPRVGIVTGASRGIGAAVARRLARDGMNLVLGYRADAGAAATVQAACRALGVEALLQAGDIGAAQTAETLVESARDAFGRVDVVVNNAGVVVESLLATLTDDELAAMLSTNIAGVVHLSRAALRPMLRQRSGCIVNVSSALATRPGRGNAVYAGTKGFVESFTRALAVEVGRKNVRVNAVAPGVIDTAMTAAVRSLAEETVLERIPQRRIGTPEEVAAAVAFLASDEASYVNGAVLGVDGAFVGGL